MVCLPLMTNVVDSAVVPVHNRTSEPKFLTVDIFPKNGFLLIFTKGRLEIVISNHWKSLITCGNPVSFPSLRIFYESNKMRVVGFCNYWICDSRTKVQSDLIFIVVFTVLCTFVTYYHAILYCLYWLM